MSDFTDIYFTHNAHAETSTTSDSTESATFRWCTKQIKTTKLKHSNNTKTSSSESLSSKLLRKSWLGLKKEHFFEQGKIQEMYKKYENMTLDLFTSFKHKYSRWAVSVKGFRRAKFVYWRPVGVGAALVNDHKHISNGKIISLSLSRWWSLLVSGRHTKPRWRSWNVYAPYTLSSL